MPTDFECNLAAASIPLSHAWEHTVGSGRALLALRADWREQLRRCIRCALPKAASSSSS